MLMNYNDSYVLFIAYTGINSVMYHGHEVLVPEMVSALFDKNNQRFINTDTEENKLLVYNFFKEHYLRSNRAAIRNLYYNIMDYEIERSIHYFDEYNNKWEIQFRTAAAVWAHLGNIYSKIYLGLKTGSMPDGNSVRKEIFDHVFQGVATQAKAEAEYAALKDEENLRTAVDWGIYGVYKGYDLINKIHSVKVYYDPGGIQMIEGQIYESELVVDPRGLAISGISDYLIPAESVSESTLWLDFEIGEIEAAKIIKDECYQNIDQFYKNPTIENYNRLRDTVLVFVHLYRAYYCTAKALESNKGSFGEFVHNLLNREKVDDKINNLKNGGDSMKEWVKFVLYDIGRLDFYADSAVAGVIIPDIEIATGNKVKITDYSIDSGGYYSGDTIGASVSVHNMDNMQLTTTIGLSVKAPTGEVYDAPAQTITINPDEVKSVSLNWNIPIGVPTGDYDAIVAVWSPDFSTRYDTSGWQADHFTIEPLINANINSYSIEQGWLRPCDYVDATVTVENTGDSDCLFYVDYLVCDKDDNWYDPVSETLFLKTGEKKTVTLSWHIPLEAVEGDYKAKIVLGKANSDGNQEELDSVTKTNAFSVYAPLFCQSVSPKSGNTETSFTYSVRYKNTEGTPPQTATLKVIGYQGSEEIYNETFDLQKTSGTIENGATYTKTITLPPAEYYTYSFRFNDGQKDLDWPLSGPEVGFYGPEVSAVETGSMYASSDPTNVSVYLDGKYMGRTPLTIPDVYPGAHEVRFRKIGYYDTRKTVKVTANQQSLVHCNLYEEQKGSVIATSNPTGVKFYLDGTYIGRTPLTIDGISVGVHNALFSELGYYDCSQSIEVSPDEPANVNCVLELKEPSSFPPIALINSPITDSIFKSGNSIKFECFVDLGTPPYVLSWYSSIDGVIGSNSLFETTDLSAGTHTITLTVTDNTGLTASDSIDVEVIKEVPHLP